MVAALVAGLLAVAGCTAPAPAPSPTPTVTTPTTTATPAPSPTPTADPEPAPAPDPVNDPADPTSWIISYAGVGPIAVGGTLGDVATTLGRTPETCRAGVDYYDLGVVGVTAVSGIDESDPAAPIVVVRVGSVDGPDATALQPHTDRGIVVGSTLAELQAAYPELEAYPGPQNATAYRALADGRSIHFEDFGTGQVQMISVAEGISVAKEYCGA